ncbi:MAG: toprim domain-containing protein [Segetibacter sp.]
MKGSSSPKDITTFTNPNQKEASVFEGFIDFLSLMVINKNQSPSAGNFVILNSVSFFEKARSIMEQHEVIRLYLDRDTTGQNYSRYARSLSSKYKDESNLYKHYKDVNKFLVEFGKIQKKNVRRNL